MNAVSPDGSADGNPNSTLISLLPSRGATKVDLFTNEDTSMVDSAAETGPDVATSNAAAPPSFEIPKARLLKAPFVKRARTFQPKVVIRLSMYFF